MVEEEDVASLLSVMIASWVLASRIEDKRSLQNALFCSISAPSSPAKAGLILEIFHIFQRVIP
jgi:hypothetical protein